MFVYFTDFLAPDPNIQLIKNGYKKSIQGQGTSIDKCSVHVVEYKMSKGKI